MNILPQINLYVKISYNEIEITNLNNGETINRKASESFSTNRLVLADFNRIDNLIREITSEMNLPNELFSRKTMIMQQLVKLDGGLCETEKRVLRDLGESSGANHLVILDDHNRLSIDEIAINLMPKEW